MACVCERESKITEALKEQPYQRVGFLNRIVLVRLLTVLDVHVYLSVGLSQPQEKGRAFWGDLQIQLVKKDSSTRKL